MKPNEKWKRMGLIGFGIFLLSINFTIAENLTLPESNRIKPGYLPTPYSAEQIRAYNQGRRVKLLIETKGKPNSFTQFVFHKGDVEKSNYDIDILDANGKKISSKKNIQTSWKELQAHASYPEDITKVKYITKTISLGIFDCWLYTSIDIKNGKIIIERRWFAKAKPGPPILLIHEENGKTIFKMTMIVSSK